MAEQGSVWQDPKYRDLRDKIVRGQREADIDLALKIKWARAGFVSIPGNLGPPNEVDTSDRDPQWVVEEVEE